MSKIKRTPGNVAPPKGQAMPPEVPEVLPPDGWLKRSPFGVLLDVYHYTTEKHHLPMILESGHLRPSNAGGAPGEPPLVWFSRDEQWEPTATKMMQGPDGVERITFSRQLEIFGCVRFSLPADDPRLMPWAEACKHAGIGFTQRRKLEAAGIKQGGAPHNWLAVSCAVPLADVRMQVFTHGKWVDRAV